MQRDALGKADPVQFESQDSESFLEVVDLKDQKVLGRLPLLIDLAKVIGIDSCFGMSKRRTQRIDIFCPELFGGKS
mgnify:CR=1 FL=1